MLYFDENVVDIERNESEKTFPLLFKYIGDEGNERTNYLYHNPEFKWLKIYSDDGSEHLGYICITFNRFHDLSMGQNQSCHISILEIKDKGQGLGTQVMNDVFAFAKDNNFKFITLQAKNDRVRDWYLKLGFYYSIDQSFLIKQVSQEKLEETYCLSYEYILNESSRFTEIGKKDFWYKITTKSSGADFAKQCLRVNSRSTNIEFQLAGTLSPERYIFNNYTLNGSRVYLRNKDTENAASFNSFLIEKIYEETLCEKGKAAQKALRTFFTDFVNELKQNETVFDELHFADWEELIT